MEVKVNHFSPVHPNPPSTLPPHLLHLPNKITKEKMRAIQHIRKGEDR